MIYIVSRKKAAAFGLDGKAVWAEVLPELGRGFKIEPDDQIYIDVSGLSAGELKNTAARQKKRFPGSFWGVIDPKGTAEDPAFFFFEGAGDYIGQALVKKGLAKKRFAAAFSRWLQSGKPSVFTDGAGAAADKKTGSPKLPAGKFEGWTSIKSGVVAPFFFLFVSISGKTDLPAMIGAADIKTVRNRFRETLQQYLREVDALLWMELEDHLLFLIPPHQTNGKLAIESALKVLMNSRLISIEKLDLSFPVEFTCALHYGKTIFRAPGKTGSIISEPVNYIFHLGVKRAETGRLTVSGDVPIETFPAGLADLFKSAGEFEGLPVRHSRRFGLKP